MRIIGKNENANVVAFFHKNKNLKFEYVPPLRWGVPNEGLFQTGEARIIFDDLCEVDRLILMLEEFKKECGHYFNNWHSTSDRMR